MKNPMLMRPRRFALISVFLIIAFFCVVFSCGSLYNACIFSHNPLFDSLFSVDTHTAVLFSDYAGTGVSQVASNGFGLIAAILILLIVVSIVISLSISFGNAEKAPNNNYSDIAKKPTATNDEDITDYINQLSEMKNKMSEYKFEEALDIKNSFDKAILSLVKVNDESDTNFKYEPTMIDGYYGSCKKIYEIARVIGELSDCRNG